MGEFGWPPGPNLIKHLYAICADIPDKNSLATILLTFLNSGAHLLEYQLFWIGCIAEDHLLNTTNGGDLLVRLYELTGEMKIARAKVLEIPVQAFASRNYEMST